MLRQASIGYADFPAAAFVAAALMMLAYHMRSPRKHWSEVTWIFLFSSFAGLTKQFGLGVHIGLLAYILYLSPNQWRRTCLIFIAVSSAAIVPFYLYLIAMHQSLTRIPWELLTNRVLYGGNTSFWWKFRRSVTNNRTAYILLLGSLLMATLNPRRLKVLFAIIAIPLWVAWIFVGSYCIGRNLLVFSLLYLIIEVGTYRIIKFLAQRHILQTTVCIMLALLVLVGSWYRFSPGPRTYDWLKNISHSSFISTSYGCKIDQLFPFIAPIEEYMRNYDVQHVITTDSYTRLLLPTIFPSYFRIVDKTLGDLTDRETGEFTSDFINRVRRYGLNNTVLILRDREVSDNFVKQNLPLLFRSRVNLPGGRVFFHNFESE